MLSHARGDSILMISAPISASSFVAYGPAHIIAEVGDAHAFERSRLHDAPNHSATTDVGVLAGIVQAVGRLATPARRARDRARARRRPRPRSPRSSRLGVASRSAGVRATPIGTCCVAPDGEQLRLGRPVVKTNIFATSSSACSRAVDGIEEPAFEQARVVHGREQRRHLALQREHAGVAVERTGRCPTRRGSGCPCAAGRRHRGTPSSAPYNSSVPAAHSCNEMSIQSPSPCSTAPRYAVAVAANACSPPKYCAWLPPDTSGARK